MLVEKKCKYSHRIKTVLALFLLQLVVVSPRAQGVLPVPRYYNTNASVLYWDNVSGNGQINNGSGTWNGGNQVWLASPAGSNISWVSGSNAVFGLNNSTGGTAGIVTVSGTRTVKNLTFNPTPSGNFVLSSGTLNLLGGVITSYQFATINSTLTSSGTVNFLKTGPSTLALGGSNSFSGLVTVSQGSLWAQSSDAFGTTSITLGDVNTGNNNVGWLWGANFVPSNNIIVSNYGTGIDTIGTYIASGFNTWHNGNIALNRDVLLYDGTNDRTSFAGVISGTGNITIDGNGTWNESIGQVARVTMDNNSNSFVGSITINPNKAFQLNNTSPVNNQKIINNGFLVLNAGTVGSIGTLTGNGICEIHPDVGAQSLSIGNDNGSGTFSGIIKDNAASLSLIKAGTGTATLNGNSSYTGITTVNGGILLRNGANTISGTTTVNSGAVIGGTGTASSSSHTVSTGGIIMGGTGTGNTGAYTIGALTFSNAGSILQVNTNGSTSASRVNIAGGTWANGFRVNVTGALNGNTTYIIISSSAATGSAASITTGTNLSGHTLSFSKSGNNILMTTGP